MSKLLFDDDKTVVILDVSNLAYRSLYTTGDLSYEDMATGVLYGIFRDILFFLEKFSTTHMVFCFDSGTWRRKRIYKGYKSGRLRKLGEMTDEEAQVRTDLRQQIKKLYEKWLPEIGFHNLFKEDGYEADDIIASVCGSYPDLWKAVISTDQDLFQLLDENTVIYNPVQKKLINQHTFESTYGISPSSWAMVKAIAGCSSDDIPGIKGVGEVTAIKYITGQLPPSTKTYQSIKEGHTTIENYAQLTQLPFPGCPEYKIREDSVDRKKWDGVMYEMGMESLCGRFPK